MSNLDNPKLIHRAVMRHSVAEVVRAVSDGENVDAVDQEGRTALFYAAAAGDEAIIAKLLEYGSNINAQDKNLETPLHFAARAYQLGAAKVLINAGAQVDTKDVNGNTPLWRAVFESRGRAQVIEFLISAGADKSLKNKHGASPEDLAKNIGNYELGGSMS